jgi:adenylate cyclase
MRREYTFLIADLAGYTALTEAHGGAEAARTIGRYLELTSMALAPGARVAERVGDQVLIVSHDPCSAVTTALRLKDAVDREPLFLGVRIGIDSGVAVEQDGKYFGSALNIAARVAAHARDGQVLCTAHVASAARGLSDIQWAPLGPVRFKNVADPVEIFEIAATSPRSPLVDPVCHMHVDGARAPASLPFDGSTYYFCSVECAEAFAKHAQAYVESLQAISRL